MTQVTHGSALKKAAGRLPAENSREVYPKGAPSVTPGAPAGGKEKAREKPQCRSFKPDERDFCSADEIRGEWAGQSAPRSASGVRLVPYCASLKVIKLARPPRSTRIDTERSLGRALAMLAKVLLESMA